MKLNFDSTTVEPRQPFSVIPRGRYTAMVTASEEKTTKRGDGSYLQLEFSVLDESAPNRKIWTRLNLNNPNETAMKIAREELAAICQALGIPHVADSEELHDRPMMIDVIVESKDGMDTNRIKAYLAAGMASKSIAAPQAPASAASPAKQPPWAKKPAGVAA